MTPEDVDTLALVLAGPIVRRVESNQVSVWVALRDARTVRLIVTGDPLGTPVEVGRVEQATLRVAMRLHVAVITLQNVTLAAGALFTYDLAFLTNGDSQHQQPLIGSTLKDPGVISTHPDPAVSEARMIERLAYPPLTRPSFATAPADVRALRLVHGSCRDVGFDSHDAMVALGQMIAADAADPLRRPHVCVLTGDQVYQDQGRADVAAYRTDVGEALFHWHEIVPETDGLTAADLPPGERVVFADRTGIKQRAKNISFTLSEFCAMYLLWWSPVLWPEVPPPPDAEVKLYRFVSVLPQVRRALANVPTYMTFDDHETIDDWNLLRDWCERVYRSELGRRVVMNALLSYTLFQAWGNDPVGAGWQPFAALQPILDQIHDAGEILPQHEAPLFRLLAMPDASPNPAVSDLGALHRTTGSPLSLAFHYVVRGPGWELIGLDQRTWRKFDDAFEPSDMLSLDGFTQQFPAPPDPPPVVTFVVSSTLVLEYPLPWWLILGEFLRGTWNWFIAGMGPGIEDIDFDYVRFYGPDVGDTWEQQSRSFERLIAKLATRTATATAPGRVILLAGDVHMGSAARLHYRAIQPYEAAAPRTLDAIFAQFTSSGCRREYDEKRQGHRWGYNFPECTDSLPLPRGWFGWNQDPHHDMAWQAITHPNFWDEHFWGRREFTGLHLRSVPERAGVQNPQTPPDWRYRIDYLLAEADDPPELKVTLLPGDGADERRKAAAAAYKQYAQRWGDGKEVVGRNNFGQILLAGPAPGQVDRATQILWWRVTDDVLPEPLTRHVVTFDPEDPDKPMHAWPGDP